MNKISPIYAERIANGFCQYCGVNPPDTSITNRRGRPNSSKTKTCIECKKARYEKYKNQPYMQPAKQCTYRREIRTKVLEMYGNKCACCNESKWEFLAIDHVNDDGHIERRALFGSQNGCSHQFYLKLLREPKREDLQVLCHNCNKSFAHYGYSPACLGCIRGTNKTLVSELSL